LCDADQAELPGLECPRGFFHLATAGLIRACVGRGDGTSNLVLQGSATCALHQFRNRRAFPVASIDAVESRNPTTVETEALGAK